MNTTLFIKKFVTNGKGIHDHVASYELAPHWKEIGKALTEFMDFGCESCNSPIKRCCGACASSMGFHYHLPANWYLIECYAKMYKPSVGFWREGKGCILPRWMRSDVCITTLCYQHAKLTPIEHAILDITRYGFEITRGRRELRRFYVRGRKDKATIHVDYKKLFETYFKQKTGKNGKVDLAIWITHKKGEIYEKKDEV